MYCYIFPLKMYGYILESRVVGESIAESRVVGEPIVACGNGFQFPSLYRRKRFSISGKVGRAETVFSFRRCTDGNGFQFPASLAENGGNGFQFPNDLSKIL
jgi:hypothetical protein